MSSPEEPSNPPAAAPAEDDYDADFEQEEAVVEEPGPQGEARLYS